MLLDVPLPVLGPCRGREGGILGRMMLGGVHTLCFWEKLGGGCGVCSVVAFLLLVCNI